MRFWAFRACLKSLHVRASATNGRYRDAHRSQGCPFWQGVQQGAWSLAALPEGLLCKSSVYRVANACRAGSPLLFRVPCSVFRVPCSVLCALQLPPLQSKAHDAKTLSRLSGVYSLHKIACFFATPIYPADPGQTRCMLLFPAYLPALAPNQHGSAGMNHPHTTHSAQTVRNAHGCFLRVYGRLLPAGRTCPVRSP